MLQDEKQLFKVFTNTKKKKKATDEERMEALTEDHPRVCGYNNNSS